MMQSSGETRREDTNACLHVVVPAKAGTHTAESLRRIRWQPIFAKQHPVDMGPGLRRLARVERHAPTSSRRVSPELCIVHHPPRNQRVQGRPGGRCTRGLAQKRFARAREPQVQAVITPALPAQWFSGLYVISPVNLADCHRRRRDAKHHRRLGAEPLGRQDHTISPSAMLPHVLRNITSTAFRSTFVTTRTPLCRSGTATVRS